MSKKGRLSAASTLPLLSVDFAFSQVPLLSSHEFRDEAGRQWDQRITIEDLEDLRRRELLVPLYRVDDDRLVPASPHPDDPSRIALFSRKGMVRDPADEDPALWSYHQPDDASPDWWNGYLYSRWQLLGLRDALRGRRNMDILPDDGADRTLAAIQRQEHLALASLSDRYFPSIIGRITYSSSAEREGLAAARRDIGPAARLAAAGYQPERLRTTAEFLLSRAHQHDPLREWWDLVRLSDANGWFRLRGAALEAMWQRIAAEVLLRAHEELAETGEIGPLPAVESEPRVWSPLLDRIGEQPHSDGISRSLAKLGLSPQPEVVLVIEGETEMTHIPPLLVELGIGQPRHVRIMNQRTSSDSPRQLARYIAPSLGRTLGDSQLIEAGPTALVVAMDAEGRHWGTQAQRDRSLRQLRASVRAEVVAQGGELTDTELDVLVQLHTWGDQKYELANFTDAQLETAITDVVAVQRPDVTTDPSWHAALREQLEYAREHALDINVVFERMRQPVSKVALAQALLPILIDALDHPDVPGHAHPPVIDLAYKLVDLVHRLSGGGYSLETPVTEPAVSS